MTPQAETFCLSEVFVKQYSAPQAVPEGILMGHFPLKSETNSCRFPVIIPEAHEPRVGVELGAQAQCPVK